jgi:hypothetical protein
MTPTSGKPFGLLVMLPLMVRWNLIRTKTTSTLDGMVATFTMNAKQWMQAPGRLVYQQQDISDDAIFDPVCVRGSIDGMRKAGRLVPGNPGHPRDVNGFSFICGLDPAMVGDTAVVCYAVDRATHKRYIVDAIKITRPTPAAIRQLIFDWTSLYSPSEWIVEKNAFQSFLTQDEGIRANLASTRSATAGTPYWNQQVGLRLWCCINVNFVWHQAIRWQAPPR